MRTKLFLAFLVVIFLSLLSNLIFRYLIEKDFEEYLRGQREDRLYLLLASVEGTFQEGFDLAKLTDALHWGMMLGFEAYVTDASGKKVLSSVDVFKELSEPMKKRMKSLFQLPMGQGQYRWFPLYQRAKEIGALYVRPLKPLGLQAQKEEVLKSRGREFLIISMVIAGGGSLALALALMLFISRPVKRLLDATARVTEGDFSVKIERPKGPLRRLFHLYDEIDNLTDNFNYMVEALRKEDEIRKQMASTIAHELRTPLTIIKGTLEAYEDGIIQSPERFVEALKKELDRLLNLVEALEDLKSAQESFFKKGTSQEIDLKEFLQEMIEPLRPAFSEKKLYLRLEGKSLRAKTYPEKLAIIIKNLLSNALRWTEQGGVTVRWGKKGLQCWIEVSDTGQGIAPEDIKTIFKKFSKGQNSEGRGLGLFIAKQLAITIDGDISVESAPGKGSTFRVVFKG